MLHAVTNLDTLATGVAIAPGLRIPYTSMNPGGSYAGAVNHLMALGKPSIRGILFASRTSFTSDDF